MPDKQCKDVCCHIAEKDIEIECLKANLRKAKEIITEFVWPSDMTTEQHQQWSVACAKFAGCTIPKFSDQTEQEAKEES